MNQLTTKRSNIIDIMKGIGIVLVVLGHTALPQKILLFIYSFHMPLFFFISGYLFSKTKYSNNLVCAVKAKSFSLLWPFITFSILAILLKYLSTQYDVTMFIQDIYDTSLGIHNLNGPLWFLTALFSVEIIFSQVIRNKYQYILIFCLITIGFLNAYYFKYRLFLNIDIALIALLFFSLGYYIRNTALDIHNKNISIVYKVSFVVILIFIIYFISQINYVNMLDGRYENILYFITTSFLGILLIILISKLITNNILIKISIYLGKNSLIILATHLVYASFINSIIGSLPFRLHNLLMLGLIGITIFIINRYFSFMVKIR
jgi:fucose 4-O-acetylase-like acetyltransferase